ncbi:ATP-binding protein [Kinneretia aquatilis]|uniref:ATP-binding protein n=1 Tax=Kinneretia aquatilis TaxID=2070761 RepID=UPI0014950941|nr:AAA family ATPase [Paucibacter aquatile]WIV97610.1 AAA family ATPase [Paucibacter aquatile]
MLCLLNLPAWAPSGEAPQALPATLPGALLLVLALGEGWQARERVAQLLWPDSETAEALHHLRVNLHRCRTLLQRWGVADRLETQGSQLRLELPTDLSAWLNAADGPPLDPEDWPRGWRLPGHEGMAQWCAATARRLHLRWLQLSRKAQPVLHRSSAPAPPAREAEHQALRHSSAPALLILGEPGAGKSTLLSSAFPHAPCLRGLEGLQGMPYRPLLETLRAQLPRLEAALQESGSPLRPYRLDLARVLPELAPDEALPPLDALTAQARLTEALTRAFEALTPVVLVDDLQWCDPASVEWLLMLAHGERLRWRGAARPHELAAALGQTLRLLEDQGRLERLDLAPLDRQALATVCQARWPERAFGEAQLDRLHAISAGNPFALGELVAAGAEALEGSAKLPQRVQQMVQRRLHALSAPARRVVEAAAISVQALPEAGLRMMMGLPEHAESDRAWEQLRSEALKAGMLCERPPGLACSHDLIRAATVDALPAERRAALHRHAALWLAQQAWADAMTIAEHWLAAAEPQTALAWRHRGAEQLKARGRFDEARAAWREVAEHANDLALALRARLELAACDFYTDLARGHAALLAVQAQLVGVADPEQRLHLEGRLCGALVANRVYAGDVPSARHHAARLHALLPELPASEHGPACEVMIELALRDSDLPAAWRWFARLREAWPQQPKLLNIEGHIHWFGGQVRAAHDALQRLLERHPDYTSGLTVENDLAVMLGTLGELAQAEALVRSSLQRWAGFAQVESRSNGVLGVLLAGQGRHAEAKTAMEAGVRLARLQASDWLAAEGLLNLARLMLQCGRPEWAARHIAEAEATLGDNPEPIYRSKWMLNSILVASALGQTPAAAPLAWLRERGQQPAHPLVQCRARRAEAELALQARDGSAALQAAERQAGLARDAGLQELWAEARLLTLRARMLLGAAPADLRPLAQEVQALAAAKSYAELHWRASAWLAAHDGSAAEQQQADAALALLRGHEQPSLFDAAAAARREPRWD